MARAIPGLGTDDLVPLVSPHAEPVAAGLTAEDYFVLTRIDGRTTLHDVILICGLPEAKAVAALQKLRGAGAIYFKGETPKKPIRAITQPVGRPIDESKLDPSVLAEECDLSADQKRAILSKHASLTTGNLFDLLEVPVDVDKRDLRASYFRLSKEYHPDRYYGRKLGSYHRRLADVFETLSKAFNLLEDDARRAEYVTRLEEEKGAGTLTAEDTTVVRRPRKN